MNTVPKAIRDEYGLATDEDQTEPTQCPFCGASNDATYSECRQCGRPLSLEATTTQDHKQTVLERLAELEEKGVLDKLDQLDE